MNYKADQFRKQLFLAVQEVELLTHTFIMNHPGEGWYTQQEKGISIVARVNHETYKLISGLILFHFAAVVHPQPPQAFDAGHLNICVDTYNPFNRTQPDISYIVPLVLDESLAFKKILVSSWDISSKRYFPIVVP